MPKIKINWIVVLVFTTFFSVIIAKNYYRQYRYDNEIKNIVLNGDETTGVLFRSVIGNRGICWHHLRYYVLNTKYEVQNLVTYGLQNGKIIDLDFDYCCGNEKCNGRKFIVKYLSEDPRRAVVLFDRPVE